MTAGLLASVLVGGAVAIGAIVVLVRLRRQPASPVSGVSPRPDDDAADTAPNLDTHPGSSERLGPAVTVGSATAESEESRLLRLQAQQRLQMLAFGKVFTALPPAALDAQEGVAAIRATLAVIADRPHYAPRRPLLLPKLMQAMNDDETSRHDLARLIATDPALAGSLLRLANSPFYRIQSEPVESLDRAIALLGLEGMRSLIAAALLQPVFRISGGMFLHFGDITWEHTLYSAGASEAHAAVLEHSDPFAGQLLALIMGLATIVVFRVAIDEFLSRQLSPNPAVLAALIDAESAPVGRRIAASWELSERIDSALADQSGPVVDRRMTRLGRSLQMGGYLGALALLHAHGMMDDEAVQTSLQATGAQADACLRIWSRLRTAPPPA